jgi:hypothetical protein
MVPGTKTREHAIGTAFTYWRTRSLLRKIRVPLFLFINVVLESNTKDMVEHNLQNRYIKRRHYKPSIEESA